MAKKTGKRVAERTTTEKLTRLATLRDAANDKLFERLELFRDVLSDDEWICANFKERSEAQNDLQVEYFPLIHGVCSAGRLLELILHFPEKSRWREHKFNLVVMIDLMKLEKGETRKIRKPKTPTKAELMQRVVELEHEKAGLLQAINEFQKANQSSNRKVASLQSKIKSMGKDIKRLESSELAPVG